MRSWPLSWYALALLVWLGIGLGICLVWGASAANQVRAAFDQETRILHRILSQRAEQHEGVLSSLVALEKTGVSQQTLSGFAAAMHSRYPQIEAIERCELESSGTGCARQQWLSGDQASLNPQPIQAALAAPSQSPMVVVSEPQQGHFALARAVNQKVFSLWINSARFTGVAEFAGANSSFQLFLSKGGESLFGQTSALTATPIEAQLLPRFTIEKALGSSSQPFWLRTQRQLRLAELPIAAMLALLMLGSGLTLGLTRFLLAVRQVRLERQEAQLALQHERARAEGTIKAVSDSLITCDREGRITFVNPAAHSLLGAEIGQPLQKVLRLQATPGQPPLPDVWAAFWNSPRVLELPEGATLLDASGQTRLVEGSLSPLEEQGQLAGAVLALRDLGPFRKRMLEALEHSEQQLREHQALLAHTGRVGTLSEVAAGIAHELNQPLTAILGHAQASLRLLEDEPLDLQKVRRSLQSSADQAQRAGRILDRLRAHVARQPLKREAVDLRQVVENVRILSEPELRQRGIGLEVGLGTEPLEVEADAIQLEQVLHNLLRNAIEALSEVEPGQRRIQISAQREKAQVRLEVRDFGPGISPEVLPQLFVPFVSAKSGGMGLGLSLSQTLVQGMGGQLKGENCPGGGARFSLELPTLTERPHVQH